MDGSRKMTFGGVGPWAETAGLRMMQDVAASQTSASCRQGVYVIAGSSAIPVLARANYYAVTSACHRFIGTEAVLYVGSASSKHSSIQKRISDHLFGDSRKSTFRQSLGLLLQAELDLAPVGRMGNGGFHFGEGEPRLTDWIGTHLQVAYRPNAQPIFAERVLQQQLTPALNIKEREWDPFARWLSRLRKDAVADLGPRPPKNKPLYRGGRVLTP